MGLDVQLGKITDPFPEFADKTGETSVIPFRTRLRCVRLARHDVLERSPGRALRASPGAVVVQSESCHPGPDSNLVVSLTGARLRSGHLPELAPAGPVCLMEREKGTSLISTVSEAREPRGHARNRLMQAA